MRTRSAGRVQRGRGRMPPDIGGEADGLWAPPPDRRTVVEEARGCGADGRTHDRVDVARTSSGLSSCAYTDRHWAFDVRDYVMMGTFWLAATVGWYACALLLASPEYQPLQWRAVGFTYALVVVLTTVLLNGLDSPGRVFFWTAVLLPVVWGAATLSVFVSPFWGPPAVCAAPFVIGLLAS